MDFKDLAQQLRARPAVTWPNGNLVERLWVVEDTIANDRFSPSPTVLTGVAATGISASSPSTVLPNAAYAFTIAGPWGTTFTVTIGSNTQSASGLGLPTGTTRTQALNALFTRFAAEHEVQPSFTPAGALCVLSSAGVNAVTAAPSPFTTGATTTKAFDPRIPAKYRRGAAHPNHAYMKVASVEISGSDQHNHNLVIFYRVDYDAMATEAGQPVDSMRSWAGYEITEPNDNSGYKSVKWTFEVMNPEVYNRPANGTPHPWVPSSVLTSEMLTERQGAHLITRFYETLPGPLIATKTGEKDGFDLTTYSKRVLASSPGTAPAPPGGQLVMESALVAEASTYVATWVVECLSQVSREESTATSAGGDGVTTRVQRLSDSMVGASANTTAISNEVQSRTASGGVAQYSGSKSDFSLPPSPTLGTNLSFKPGVTLRSTSQVVASPNERTNVADYSNQIAERNVFGAPLSWRENVTISSFTPLTAGVEKQVRPGVELATTQRYSLDTTLSSPTGSASISHWDPSLTVYQLNETNATIKPGDAGTEIQAQPGYRVIINSKWSLTNAIATPTGNAQVFYDDGVTRGYKTEERQLQLVPITFESARIKSPLIERRVISRFTTNPAIATDNGQAGIAITDGTTHIYEVKEDTYVAQAPKEYSTLLQAAVPPVLLAIQYRPVLKINGADEWVVTPILEEGYRGTFQGKVREYWSATPPATDAFFPTVFRPMPIQFNGARLNFNLEGTLHGAIRVSENIGTNDPEYLQQSIAITFPATNPPAIPVGWQPYALDVDPMENGGYRVREISILYK